MSLPSFPPVFLGCLLAQACAAPPASRPASVRPADSSDRGPYAGRSLYLEPDSNAARQAALWRTSDPDGAAVMDQLAQIPVATWLGDWTPDPAGAVDDLLTRAAGDLVVLVLYDIPDRDCGSFSAGGASDGAAYETFVEAVASGLGGREALVVLEPDALALDDCLDSAARDERRQLLGNAVDLLNAAGGTVYLDAGDSAWVPSAEMADRLLAAGVDRAAGFAINVSHTEFTADEVAYANELRVLLGDEAHYLVDTGRNGLGPDPTHEWCNPTGRANGRHPTLRTHRPGLDALLWVKPPGESDGDCGGGPAAGSWWPEYALDLALAGGFAP